MLGMRNIRKPGTLCAKKVLRAVAMTYVAGVASSAGYLVYIFLIAGRWLLGRPKP